MYSKKPTSNTTRPSWRVCPEHVYSVGLNSRAKIAQAIAETWQRSREAETDEERDDADQTLEWLAEEKWEHEQSIKKAKKTRRENKRAARWRRMGGQGAPPPLRWVSLFDAERVNALMNVGESGAGCDAAGTTRKKQLGLRKRRLRSGGTGKRTVGRGSSPR